MRNPIEVREEFFKYYPELRILLTCTNCHNQGTIYAYIPDTVKEPLLNEQQQPLLDKAGNPRTVERQVEICRHCGCTKHTITRR